ncbi:thioredoxin domain-containing protein isoform X1 [Drosophila tropicalis]|uniref:thioredoxin domain-containing protein isoform X1 n=1 Tax=Drosophila tropicalis TaxID=46794 RepID=UPI0035AB9E34
MFVNKLIGVYFITLCLIIYNIYASEIDRVDDTDLIHLLTGKGNVIALFTKNNCPTCVEYETVVSNIQNELKETLKADIVLAQDSNLVTIYDPTKEPALIYFRQGIPILYHGPVKEDQIVEFFNENQEPVVKELSDENFEHLTQASTGATTGDWFIFFYSADCVFCQRLYAVWESVGGKLKHRLNVARINRLEAGVSTAKRLKVFTSPEFILLRQGKIYRYNSKDYTPEAFVQFAESGFQKQTHPEKVPPEASFINDLVFERLQGYIKSANLAPLVAVGFVILIILVITVKRFFKKTQQLETKNKKK